MATDRVEQLMARCRDFRVKYWRDRTDEKRDCATMKEALRTELAQAEQSGKLFALASLADVINQEIRENGPHK